MGKDIRISQPERIPLKNAEKSGERASLRSPQSGAGALDGTYARSIGPWGKRPAWQVQRSRRFGLPRLRLHDGASSSRRPEPIPEASLDRVQELT